MLKTASTVNWSDSKAKLNKRERRKYPWVFRRVQSALEHVVYGRLTLITPDGAHFEFQGDEPGFTAELTLNKWRMLTRFMLGGDVGLAESYRDGDWDSPCLQSVFCFALQNWDALEPWIEGRLPSRIMGQVMYWFQQNTLRGSRRNIQAHYDLSNEFYSLWLDESMTYSSGLFSHAGQSLQDAQHQKYDRILDQLTHTDGQLLEIGCGWGGLAERALGRGNFEITGLTLSDEQHQYAQQRLGEQAQVQLRDYRHQRGQFDHIVSIEMFEAVGEKYWTTYFDQLKSLLKQGGRAVVQTITIADDRFETYRRSVDVVRSYIFPGGMLPSPMHFNKAAQASGLRVGEHHYFGQDYALTMHHWLERFEAQLSAIKSLGFDEPFIRLWRFYLAVCHAGFKTERTNVMQVVLSHA
jgi:cyclopropane-fatty-acyl-phospholipid synthase